MRACTSAVRPSVKRIVVDGLKGFGVAWPTDSKRAVEGTASTTVALSTRRPSTSPSTSEPSSATASVR